MLEPLHLTYTIKDEVLKITSEQIRDGDVYIARVLGGRSGDSHSELCAEQQYGPAGADQRRVRRHGRRGRGHARAHGGGRRRAAGRAYRARAQERDGTAFGVNRNPASPAAGNPRR